MSRTRTFLAGRRGTADMLLLVCPLILSACGEQPAAAPTEPPAPLSVPTKPPIPTDVPIEVPPTDTPVPAEDPMPEPVDDTACIGCITYHGGVSSAEGMEVHEGIVREPDSVETCGPPTPSCQDAACHPAVAPGDGVAYHTDVHFGAMSCQVCHSTTYKNCYSGHVAQEGGAPFFRIEPSVMSFKIGRNPIRSAERPWAYVPVRHVPVDTESFAYDGKDLLPNFGALSTWKYATPHNIQRNTPKTESCDACHGNPKFFLTADDVLPEELEANKDVVVEEVPGLGGQ